MRVFIQFSKHILEKGDFFSVPDAQTVMWIKDGKVQQGTNVHSAGDGFYSTLNQLLGVGAENEVFCFSVSRDEPNTAPRESVLVASFNWPYRDAIFRLDTVTFPQSAIAYRHVHAGAGIRYLTKGSLEIQSDHHVEHFSVGQAWFEDANSPVKATASGTEVSQFIRALILPIEYEGKSTIKFLNSEDFEKPKLQTNLRFLDQRISL